MVQKCQKWSKMDENLHKAHNLCGSSILKDMGIFVFIHIYRQIQKYPYLLKYLNQRSEICCASLPHKVRTLCQFLPITCAMEPNFVSRLMGEKDRQKFEAARELKVVIANIRVGYMLAMNSTETLDRQRAVAVYFIDKLSLRLGIASFTGQGRFQAKKRLFLIGHCPNRPNPPPPPSKWTDGTLFFPESHQPSADARIQPLDESYFKYKQVKTIEVNIGHQEGHLATFVSFNGILLSVPNHLDWGLTPPPPRYLDNVQLKTIFFSLKASLISRSPDLERHLSVVVVMSF